MFFPVISLPVLLVKVPSLVINSFVNLKKLLFRTLSIASVKLKSLNTFQKLDIPPSSGVKMGRILHSWANMILNSQQTTVTNLQRINILGLYLCNFLDRWLIGGSFKNKPNTTLREPLSSNSTNTIYSNVKLTSCFS
jgi:hypothetical protein